MEKFLIKRASTSENKKRKLSETTTDQPINEELEEKKTLNFENQKKERKYQYQYIIQFGFTFIEEKGKHRPKCVICLEILASESMKPSKLKRHLEMKHPQYSNKDEQFFKRYENALKVQKKVFNTFSTVSQKALVAPFEVSYLIAKTKKPHSIGESLVLPAAIKIVTAMHGEAYANDLKSIPLSDNTVSRRISNISDDILKQLLNRLRSNYFAMLDESTDISNFSQLLVYVRYIYKEDILEDFLFCQTLNGRTTGNDIFTLINTFFENNEISWSLCKAISTDSAAALTGSKKGFRAKVNEISPSILFTHCMIHREALASKNLNHLSTKTRICNEMESDHTKLLLHTEVRWLSRGKILLRIVELKDEIRIFLLEHKNTLAEHFLNEECLVMNEELIELSFDENLRIQFNETISDTFWISIKSEYPELSKIAISTLLPFATTYLCETAFSALTVIKTNRRYHAKTGQMFYFSFEKR
ncbi:protein FAM200B-like [Acyrthosiphon pisum]|uniref:BED-type domain-containing protein n=1 Tax=Acyrthosiphon pisum TaxID=7029 RepID=A0A8R2AYL3_ACYPI|nr:protein FAM200B-like [Acyrthosiphon pisum]|eukprot:XP_008178224.1 PREDICTED: protein FAM200B-like [Acyrthosiphon pisum]